MPFFPVSNIEIDSRALAKGLERVKKFEPAMKNRMTKDIRSVAYEFTGLIEDGVPVQPPLSGLTGNWGRPSSTVRTFPKAPDGRAIATINVGADSRRFAKYLQMTETAGTRSSGFTPSGKQMIRVLEKLYPLTGKGGRFVWRSFLTVKPEIRERVVLLINAYIVRFNKLGRL